MLLMEPRVQLQVAPEIRPQPAVQGEVAQEPAATVPMLLQIPVAQAVLDTARTSRERLLTMAVAVAVVLNMLVQRQRREMVDQEMVVRVLGM